MTSTDDQLRPQTRQPQRRGMGKRYETEWRTTKDCVIYARVSTGERKNTKQKSIPDQIRLATAAAERLGYRVVGVYQDGRSRGVRRLGLHRLLAEVPDLPSVGAVFIWMDNRLWGHQEQQRFLLYRFRQSGVRVYDADCQLWKDDTPMDKLKNMFSAGISEYETGMTAQRIYSLYVDRASLGEILQKPPFGVRVAKRVEGEQIVSEWAVVPNQMDVIRRVVREYAHGVPSYEIAQRLHNERIPTQRGTYNWSASNIRRYLDNELYIGELVWNRTKTEWEIDPVTGDKIKKVAHRREDKWIRAKSPLGVILADYPEDDDNVREWLDLWARCQQRRDSQGRERQARVYDIRPFQGLVVCDRCGQQMQARRFGHKLASGERTSAFDFRCPTRANTGSGCTKSHTMSEAKLTGLMRQGMMQRISGEAGNSLVTFTEERPDSVLATQAARRTLEQKQAAVTRVYEAHEAGAYPDADTFKGRLALVTEEADQAERALAALIVPETSAPEAITGERCEKILKVLDMMYDVHVDLDLRRSAAFDLFKEIRVNNPRVTVTLRLGGL